MADSYLHIRSTAASLAPAHRKQSFKRGSLRSRQQPKELIRDPRKEYSSPVTFTESELRVKAVFPIRCDVEGARPFEQVVEAGVEPVLGILVHVHVVVDLMSYSRDIKILT